MADKELGEYYTVPVILSMRGIDAQVNKTMGKAFKGVGAQGGKEIAAGLKASEADIKKAFDNHAKLADKAADATGKLRVAQAGYNDLVRKGITDGKRYEAAVAAKAKAARDETRAVKTATDALKDYEKAAKNAQGSGEKAGAGFLTGIRGASAGAGSAGSEAAAGFAEGFAGSAALLRLGAVGGPVGIAVAAAGTVLGGLLWKNIEAGIEREPGRDLIQARLGATAEEMKVIGRASGAAYANNFGDSLASNFQASQLAIQGGLVTDAFDPMLQKTAEKLQAISTLVGGELTETTKSASILLRSGMADSADEAFDIIAKGFQVTGDLGADWLDSIGEYSSGWKNAGLTAEQALALIKQAQDNGVDVTDRSADALREFGRRISEEGPKMVAILDAIGLNGQDMYDKFKKGGPEAFNAFDQVFDKIRGLKDPVDRNQVALALLGDTAGDFVDAFAKWDPSSAVDSLGSIQGAAQNASDTMGDNVVGSFESAKRTIDVALDGVQDSLAAAFGPSLKDLADGVVGHKDEITGAFIDMGQVLGHVGGLTVGILGGVTKAFGLFAGGIGNVLGGILKTGSALQRLTGDTETADEWNRQADALFGLGEDSQATGDSLINLSKDIKTATDKLGDMSVDVGDADKTTGGLGDSVKLLGDNVKKLPATLPPWMKDLATGGGGTPGGPQNPLLVPLGPGTPGGAPPPLLPGVTPGGGGRGGLMNLQIAAGAGGPGGIPRKVGSDNGLMPATVSAKDQIASAFSNINDIGGWRPPDGFNEHSSGQAIDVMVPGWNTPGGKSEGDQIAAFALKNPAVDYVLWQQTQWNADGTSKPMTDRGSPTENHMDHVHVHTRKGAASGSSGEPGSPVAMSSGTTSGSGGLSGSLFQDAGGQWRSSLPGWDHLIQRESSGVNQVQGITDVNSGGNEAEGLFQITPQTWAANGGTRFAPNPLAATPQQQAEIAAAIFSANPSGSDWGAGLPGRENPTQLLSEMQGVGPGINTGGPAGSSSLINAFGNEYKPGIGTPGYNEYGEPGYYETDPRQIQQATRGVEDNAKRIADTQAAIADADASLADALQERDRIAKLSEIQRVTEGVNLDKAQDAVDRAKKEADQSRTDAKRAKEDAQYAGQDLQDAQKGSFKQASKAPKGKSGGSDDLSGLGGIASSFLTETFGLDGSIFPDIGNLMPVKMAGTLLGALMPQSNTLDAGGGTSSSPFGIPDVAVPPAPAGTPASGFGAGPAPGPAGHIISIDQSIGNVNGDVGTVMKKRDEGLGRAVSRIPWWS